MNIWKRFFGAKDPAIPSPRKAEPVSPAAAPSAQPTSSPEQAIKLISHQESGKLPEPVNPPPALGARPIPSREEAMNLISHKEFRRLGEKDIFGNTLPDSKRGDTNRYLNGTWDRDDYDGVFLYKKTGYSGDLIAIGIPVFAKAPDEILAAIGLPEFGLQKGSPCALVAAALLVAPEVLESDAAKESIELYRLGSPDSYVVICIFIEGFGLSRVDIIPTDIYDSLKTKASHKIRQIKTFTDNGDGTVTDDKSGLMWQKKRL